MMDNASAVVFLVLFLIFVGWFYGPWQTLCIDWARERMFEARNAIFDMGADRRLNFDSPEYRELRHRIEGNIRFIHRMSWPTLVFLYLGVRQSPLQRSITISELLASFPNNGLREDIRKQTDTIAWVILRVMILRSVLLLMIFAITWIVWQCGAPVYRFCKSTTERLVEMIQIDALAFDRKTPFQKGTPQEKHEVSA